MCHTYFAVTDIRLSADDARGTVLICGETMHDNLKRKFGICAVDEDPVIYQLFNQKVAGQRSASLCCNMC